MLDRQAGEVTEITAQTVQIQKVVVRLADGSEVGAICFGDLVGWCQVGDRVVLNRTARSLNLGSGGWDFVMAIVDRTELQKQPSGQLGHGHLIKLRYTPAQMAVLAWDEEASPVRPRDPASYGDLDDTPVLIAGVHSLVEPIVRGLAVLAEGCKIAYIHTDAACLPAAWSQVIALLKAEGLLTTVISSGHSFGGDYEALNNYSALACAKEVVKADFILACMGPGIPGTGTKYGSTAIEVGELINAVAALNGRPLAVPRLSFADRRSRHYGISHHFITALEVAAFAPAQITFPFYREEEHAILQQLAELSGLTRPNRNGVLHELVFCNVTELTDRLKPHLDSFSSMGRSFSEDPLHFAAGLAAAQTAVSVGPIAPSIL